MIMWKDVPGWEKLYQASEDGRIRSYDRECGARNKHVAIRKGRILKPIAKSGRYLVVSLTDGKGRRKQMFVHDVIALTWIGQKPRGLHTCHTDDNKYNNHVDNLRYDTAQGNNDDIQRNGKRPKGSAHGCAKLTELDVSDIRASCLTDKEIAGKYQVTPGHVYSIRTRRSWRHI